MPSRRTLSAGLVILVVAGALLAVPLAERRALAAEEAYVANRLGGASCLSEWGVNEGAADGGVSVTGVSVRGLRVSVALPYAHTTETDGEPVYADSVSEAVYVVSPVGARRVGGDRIHPC